MLARLDHTEDVAVRHDRGQGQDAATERLAEQVDVGHDAVAVARERLAHAGEPGLDLVGDEQHVVARADLAHRAQVALGRQHDAGLALDRLDQHGGGRRRDRGLDRRGVAERHGDESRCERAEALARLVIVAEADDRGGAAMEVAVRDDDGRGIRLDALHPVAPRACHLDAGLDGLGAGVHRQDEVLAAEVGEGRREGAEAVVVVRAAGEGEAVELLLRGGEERRMPVAEVQGRVGREQIEVALALDVGHPRALAAGDDDRQRVVVVGDVLVLVGDDAGHRGVDGCLGGGHVRAFQRRSSSVQHLMPPPPSSSSDRSTSTGL